MPRILYTRPTSVTGRALRDGLRIRGSMEDDGNRSDFLIRWGNSSRIARRPRRLLNRRTAVELATHKLDSLRVMQDEHVRVPPFWTAEEMARWRAPAVEGPLLGRRRNHRGGQDIQLLMQMTDVRRVLDSGTIDFATRYIPVAREFRVHVFQGAVLKISEKVLTNVEEFQFPWMRNFDNGYTFHNIRRISDALRREVEQQSIRAVEALNLDFGAVDIILGDDTNGYVLEVNTGPSLSDASLSVYLRKFAEVLGIDENDINWPEAEDVNDDDLEDLLD